MKLLAVLILSSLLVSCQMTKDERTELSILSIKDAQKNDVSFIDSIRVVPLETIDTALIRMPKLFQYVPEIDDYLIMDYHQTVFLYDKNGKYWSSSVDCMGNGPKQYQMGIDALYNPYEDVVEICDPRGGGRIYQYDLNFDFVGCKEMNLGTNLMANSFSLIHKDTYSFSPVRFDDKGYIETLHFADSKHTELDTIFCPKDNYVSEVTMMQKEFTSTSKSLYYTPHYMDYHFYTFDMQHKQFHPILKLDFGEDMLVADDLDKKFGALSNDKLENMQNLQQRNEYLLSSNYMLPIIRLINDKFVYVHCIKNSKPFHLIYNRTNGKKYWMTGDADFVLNRCFSLHDNVLYTFINAYELDKYINESHYKYMSEASIEALKRVEEEDNPVVIEYHLHED